MKCGINVPNFGSYSDVRAVAELARVAEDAGWDGFFMWDHMQMSGGGEGPVPFCDPWVALTAVALRTERIRIGTMVTPVPRRRPWVLARQTATLDRVSGGRVIFGAGLGHPPEEYTTFGEDPDDRVKARKLDEGLEVLAGLWSGEPFSYDGAHYRIAETAFRPTPVQQPRIPVWTASWGTKRGPLRRAARWDGIFPIAEEMHVLTPSEIAAIVARVRALRSKRGLLAREASDAPFDVAFGGESSPYGPFRRTEPLSAYQEAGATWFMESLTDWRGAVDTMHDFVRAGPPQ